MGWSTYQLVQDFLPPLYHGPGPPSRSAGRVPPRTLKTLRFTCCAVAAPGLIPGLAPRESGHFGQGKWRNMMISGKRGKITVADEPRISSKYPELYIMDIFDMDIDVHYGWVYYSFPLAQRTKWELSSWCPASAEVITRFGDPTAEPLIATPILWGVDGISGSRNVGWKMLNISTGAVKCVLYISGFPDSRDYLQLGVADTSPPQSVSFEMSSIPSQHQPTFISWTDRGFPTGVPPNRYPKSSNHPFFMGFSFVKTVPLDPAMVLPGFMAEAQGASEQSVRRTPCGCQERFTIEDSSEDVSYCLLSRST